jgi:glucose-6-phosphate isomerase
MSINIDLSYARDFLPEQSLENWKGKVFTALETVRNRNGLGNDFLGWLDLPETSLKAAGEMIKTSREFAHGLDAIVVVGIGGSYLGTKAVYEALGNPFGLKRKGPELLFAGHHLVDVYYTQLLNYLEGKQWGIIVVSKSGTTTEPAIAFRILKQALETSAGIEVSKNRIIAITDHSRGALRKLSTQMGYKTFIIPDDVGGRFSVLSPVGLVPLAAAGFDIEQMLRGALAMKEISDSETNLHTNPVALYAAVRNILLSGGKTTEVLCSFQPQMHFVAEWWKQLYGESEGKNGKGIFPASVEYTTDLHSMGQYMQDGMRNLFETLLDPESSNPPFPIPADPQDLDGLNFLAGKDLKEANKAALTGTAEAHVAGGVPVVTIKTGPISEYMLGELFYFFEKACAVSGYLLGVNPFDQPGVELYKKNMFRLLGKPGY